jgi:hypothetical protein
MACTIHQYLRDEGVRAPKMQPCPIRDGFVRFTKPLERERFLQGPPHQFG